MSRTPDPGIECVNKSDPFTCLSTYICILIFHVHWGWSAWGSRLAPPMPTRTQASHKSITNTRPRLLNPSGAPAYRDNTEKMSDLWDGINTINTDAWHAAAMHPNFAAIFPAATQLIFIVAAIQKQWTVMIKEYSICSSLTQSVPQSQDHKHKKKHKNFTHQNQPATVLEVDEFISIQKFFDAAS